MDNKLCPVCNSFKPNDTNFITCPDCLERNRLYRKSKKNLNSWVSDGNVHIINLDEFANVPQLFMSLYRDLMEDNRKILKITIKTD